MPEESRDAATTSPPPEEISVRDQLDPELVSLRRPGPRIGLITAGAVVIGCVALMIRLHRDFVFSRAGETAHVVTIANLIAGNIAEDSYVTVTAPLERTAAVRVRVTEANAGTRLVPVEGSNDKLWIALAGDEWSPFQYDYVVTGRLRTLSAVRFSDAVASFVAEHPAPRFVSGADLKRARTSTATGADGTLTVLGGGQLAVQPTHAIEFVLPDPSAAMIVATFNSRFPNVAAWTAALAAADVIEPGAAPTRTTEDTARWAVARSSATAAQALEASALWGARAEPATAHVRSTWGELASDDSGVRSATGVIPWSAIDVAAVWAPRTLPTDARVLLVGETPSSYWYLPPVYVGLGLFAALFTWALALAIRRHFFDNGRAVSIRP